MNNELAARNLQTEFDPIDGIICSNCFWAGEITQFDIDLDVDITIQGADRVCYVPKYCPECGAKMIYEDE